MNLNVYDTYCAGLPHTFNVIQWGGASVWKVGLQEDKKNKVFAIGGLRTNDDGDAFGISFKCSDIGFEVLKDTPGCRPAPYMASRGMKWIQWMNESGLSWEELKPYLEQSHRLSARNLTKTLQRKLGLIE